jgi:hypothetical protein
MGQRKKLVRWTEPKEYLRRKYERSKIKNSSWLKLAVGSLAGSMCLLGWYLARFDPSKTPTSFPVALGIAIGVGLFLAYVCPWLDIFTTSEITICNTCIGQIPHLLSVKQLNSYHWTYDQDLPVWVIVYDGGRTRSFGTPDDETKQEIIAAMESLGVPETGGDEPPLPYKPKISPAIHVLLCLAVLVGLLASLFFGVSGFALTGGDGLDFVVVLSVAMFVVAGFASGGAIVVLGGLFGGLRLDRHFSYLFTICLGAVLGLILWVLDLFVFRTTPKQWDWVDWVWLVGIVLGVLCGRLLTRRIKEYGCRSRVWGVIGMLAALLVCLKLLSHGAPILHDHLFTIPLAVLSTVIGGILGAILGAIIDRLRAEPDCLYDSLLNCGFEFATLANRDSGEHNAEENQAS